MDSIMLFVRLADLLSLSKLILLHIMCGYQFDKAVNKNDTREVI